MWEGNPESFIQTMEGGEKNCFFCSCKKNGFTLRVFQGNTTFNFLNP